MPFIAFLVSSTQVLVIPFDHFRSRTEGVYRLDSIESVLRHRCGFGTGFHLRFVSRVPIEATTASLTILASMGASNLMTTPTESTMAGMTLMVIRASFHWTASATM